ncbi:MAG: hypothetical protein R2867_29260 [Caldilineaceae bacterium]
MNQKRPQPSPKYTDGNEIARQLLITGSSDQTVRVWDVETSQSRYALHGQPRTLAAIAIRPLPPLPRTSSSVVVQEAAQSADWLLAAAGYDHAVHLWTGVGNDANDRSHTLRGPSNALYAVAFSPDGRITAGGGHDKLIYLMMSLSVSL